jgi:tRNA A37 threonylcarbamoyladenosine dehydratase
MKYPTDIPVKVIQLGAGGTGGHIVPHIYRLLYSLDRPARYIICDGDVVEEKNLVRQNFAPIDQGENKARVLAERYASVFGMEAEYVPSFVEDLDTLMELITPKDW